MNKKIVITAAGNTILDDENIVASYVSGKNVLFKSVKDLNVGELVCYDAQYIDKTLEDIEPDLLKDSRRYRVAKNSLHIDGQTALSYYLNNSSLLKGLNEDEKADKLYETIGKKVTKQTIKDWLSGKTVMPEMENLELITGIHTELNDFYEGFQKKKEGLAYPLYDLYNNIRRGLGHYLAKPKGSGTGEKKEVSTPLESITLAPEIDIVVKRYFNKINNEMNSVRVNGIKELERKDALKISSSENYEKLKKGVLRIKPENKHKFLEKNELNEVSFDELFNDHNTIFYTIGKYVSKILNEKLNLNKFDEKTKKYIKWIDDTENASRLFSKYLEKYVSSRKLFLYKSSPDPTSVEKHKENYDYDIDVRCEDIWDGLNNQFREKLTEEENIIMEKLTTTIDSLSDSFPQIYLEQVELMKKFFNKIAELKSRYKEQPMPQKEIREVNDLINKSNKRVRELQKEYNVNLSELKTFHKGDEIGKPLTDADGKAALKKYGMEELIPKIFG